MAERKINYGVFIAIGASLIGFGVVFMFAVNTIVGLSLLSVGFGNMAIGVSGKRRKE